MQGLPRSAHAQLFTTCDNGETLIQLILRGESAVQKILAARILKTFRLKDNGANGAKDPAASSQEKATILDVARKTVQRASRVQRCFSHVAPVKVPRDRNPCLTFVAAKNNSGSGFTKEGDV